MSAAAQATVAFLEMFCGSARGNITDAARAAQAAKIDTFLQTTPSDQSFRLSIPAFPFKSSHADKVVGNMPDLGEKSALMTLWKLANGVSERMSRPVEVVISRDGYVFNDVFEIPNETVSSYQGKLFEIATSFSTPDVSIQVIGLENYLASETCSQNPDKVEIFRTTMMDRYGVPADEAEHIFATDEQVRRRLGQLGKFYQTDLPRRKEEGESCSQFSKRFKNAARQIWLRSEAWSRLMQERNPDAFRLSIHPYTDMSEKWPVQLVPSIDGSFRSPWFNAPVEFACGKVMLTLARDAREMGCTLEYQDNQTANDNPQPWCYKSPEPSLA